MEWKALLERELTDTYRTAERLVGLTDDSMLDWKPSSGENWMTTGQLLKHVSNACGFCFNGFATGEWRMPEHVEMDEDTAEPTLTPAESLPTVTSVSEAKELLEEDRQLALNVLASLDETTLGNKKVSAPWDPRDEILGFQLLHMIEHLAQHRSQLFYYLKLQGKPVNTMHLWG